MLCKCSSLKTKMDFNPNSGSEVARLVFASLGLLWILPLGLLIIRQWLILLTSFLSRSTLLNDDRALP